MLDIVNVMEHFGQANRAIARSIANLDCRGFFILGINSIRFVC